MYGGIADGPPGSRKAEVHDIGGACRLAQAIVSNAMQQASPPIKMTLRGVLKGKHVVDAARIAALRRRAQLLRQFSKGVMVAHYANAYELDEKRVRRAIEKNAQEHEDFAKLFESFSGTVFRLPPAEKQPVGAKNAPTDEEQVILESSL